MRTFVVAAGMAGLLVLSGGTAWAQVTDYSAGKTPAQLFSSDCSACHQSTRGLAKGRDQRALATFLREHYTTKAESAGALAAYLAGAPGAQAAPAGRQGAARGQPPRAIPGDIEPDEPFRASRRPPGDQSGEPGSILAPEGGGPEPDKRRQHPPKEAAKPPVGPKGKKLNPAEAAQEAARVEEAARAATKAKVRAYATTGEEARPKIGPDGQPVPPPAAAVAPAATPPAPAAAAPAPDAAKPAQPAASEPKATESKSPAPGGPPVEATPARPPAPPPS